MPGIGEVLDEIGREAGAGLARAAIPLVLIVAIIGAALLVAS